MTLVVGRAYYLRGMRREMWNGPHEKFGMPESIAGFYLGCLEGNRRWHGFEIWLDGKEEGVIFMNDQDLGKLEVTDINEM